MRLSELANETFAQDPDIAGLTADSRTVEKGYLFAALPGVNADGAQFIPKAEARGAAAVLAKPGVQANVPVVVDKEPRRRLSQMAARFYSAQPRTIAGVTGTNGKTSTALFTAQMWDRLGRKTGSLGTLGARSAFYERDLAHTTPEPVTLHKTLHEMAGAGVDYLAMEVSSHGLAQYRADSVRFSIAAFTNITQDHLDYHDGFEAYFSAKARLFVELLQPEGVAVINMDGEGAREVYALARKRGLRTITTGATGEDLKLLSATPHAAGMAVEIGIEGESCKLNLPLLGLFQAENALLAAGVAIAAGEAPAKVVPLLECLSGVPGRMERAAVVNDAGIYIDYAHTPDALAAALQAIRPHAEGRVIAVFGAGGDRDKEKRPLMGKAVRENADKVIVTDDNPRTEDAAIIRQAVLAECPSAIEVGDRAEAIAAGVAMLQPGDVLVVLGKGHETGQQVGGETLPFDDAQVARAAALNREKELGR